MIHRTLICVFAFLGACTTFEPIERNVCGNGIIEPGEDCDSHDTSCVACAITCKAATDCPNATYACGVDGLCHAPSGVLAPATAPSLFLVDDLRITDVDQDGIGDVLGVSKTSLEVRFGDAQASLASTFSTVTPPQSGPAGFGDLDGDGIVDTTLVTPDGIVAYTSPYGIPSPAVSFLPLAVNGQVLPIRALFPIRGVAVGAVVEDMGTSTLFLEVISFNNAGTFGQNGAFCSLPAGDFTPDDLDVYQASGATDPIDITISALTHGTTRHLCAVAIHILAPATDGSRAASFYDITPTAPNLMRRPVWANVDFDTDPCPSLLNSDGGGMGLKAWAGSTSANHCTLAATQAALPVAPGATAATVVVGRIPLTPGIPFVGGDVLVLSNGLYVYNVDVTQPGGVAFTPVYQSERTLNGVAFGDLDGNGSIDAALSAEGDTDLDIVYRANDNGLPAFVIDRIDTAGVVTSVAINDYDGNGIGDIAYIEQVIDHQALTVAYGQPGHTQITLPEGVFASVVSTIPFQVVDSSDPYGVVDDVLILEQLPSSSNPALTLLHGSPQRTMLSYFEPRASNDPLRDQPMRNVVAGNFVSSTGTMQYPDLLSFLPNAAALPGNASVNAYLLDGTSDGLNPSDPIDTALGERIGGLDDCSGTGPTPSGEPCIRNASLMPWTTGASHDTVIGVDHGAPPEAFVLDPWSFTVSGTTAAKLVTSPTANVPAGAVVHSSHAADLDGDGSPELVVSFAPAETAAASGAGLVEACTMDSTGMPTTCVDLSTPITALVPGVSCVDAAPGLVLASGPSTTPPATPQLVVLCHDTTTGDSLIARVWWQSGAYQAELLASDLGPLRAIQVGDVTGDGVDDIVAIRGDSGERSLTVLAQCGSRDLSCQATGVAP